MTIEEIIEINSACLGDAHCYTAALVAAKLRAADELCEAAYRAYEADYTDNLLGYIEAYENAGKGE